MRGAIYALDEVTENGNVPVYCPRCGGRGYMEEYRFTESGRCFECWGRRGPVKFVPLAEAEKIERRRAKDRERRNRAAREAAEEFARKVDAWREENGEIVEALEGYKGHSSFILDVAARVEGREILTDAQVEAARKALQAEEERAATEVDVPEGRQVVEGTIVSVKEVLDTFSYRERYITKVLVDCGGFRIYGTLPGAIGGADKGDRVRFTATLEGKEKGFGFYKRPTKAEILEPVAA